MHIRPYTENDYPAVLEIYRRTKLDELRFEEKTFELLPLEQDERRYAQFRASDIYVFDNGCVVAYGAVCGSEIRGLYVLPEMRGQGIGRRLLTFLLSKMAGPVDLYVAKTNAPAKRLYRNFGFSVVDEFETDYNGVPVFANKMTRRPLA